MRFPIMVSRIRGMLLSFSFGTLVGVVGIGLADSRRSLVEESEYFGRSVIQLSGRMVSESRMLQQPTEIMVLGQNLVVIDARSDSVVHVFDRDSGVHRASFGTRGDGHCQFQSAWAMATFPDSEDGLWLYDLTPQRFTQLRVGPTDYGCDLSVVNFEGRAIPTGPVWLDTTSIAGFGFNVQARLEIYDRSGVYKRGMPGVIDPERNIPQAIWDHAYQSTTVLHPGRSMIAAVPRYASDIEIYSTSHTKGPVIGFGPESFSPPFEPSLSRGENKFVFPLESRIGYIDATASREFIFGLYSGRSYVTSGESAYFGRFVVVFDWNGILLETMQLESDALAIAFDSDGRNLFVVRHSPRPAVDMYAIDGILNSLGASYYGSGGNY